MIQVLPLMFALSAQPASSREAPLPLDRLAPEVRAQFEEALARVGAEPDSPEAAGRLGMLLHAYEEYELAIEYYEKARKLDERDFRWGYYLGVAHAALGKHRPAAALFQQALGLDPEYLPARLKLAESLLEADKPRESGRVFREIVEEFPDSAAAHYGLGRVEVSLGDHRLAVLHLGEACRLYPDFGAAHYALALLLRDLDDLDRAREHLSRYAANPRGAPPQSDPLIMRVWELDRTAFAHLERGVDLESAGQLEAAVEEHERALRVNPRLAQAHVNLITIFGKLGRFEKAEEHFQAAVRINPDLAEAHYNHGVILERRNRSEAAFRAFEKALEINPHYAAAHNNYGYLLERQGRLEDAMRHYRAALENEPNYRLAHFHAGRLLLHERRTAEAIAHFEQTLTPEDGETPGFMYALAIAHARAGSHETALEHAREARRRAAGLGQNDLVTSIDRDIELLERLEGTPSRNREP
jgi:tetratricopeptide (TPR) repeat protein